MTKQEILEYFNDINHAYNESTRLDDLSHMLDELMQGNLDGDCISRKEVCDYIAEFVNHEYATDREHEMVEHIISGIQHLPSIQPKKNGHWIYRLVGIYRYASCSECNKMQVDESNYCPNCGAKMEE